MVSKATEDAMIRVAKITKNSGEDYIWSGVIIIRIKTKLQLLL